jgi:deltex-like protein
MLRILNNTFNELNKDTNKITIQPLKFKAEKVLDLIDLKTEQEILSNPDTRCTICLCEFTPRSQALEGNDLICTPTTCPAHYFHIGCIKSWFTTKQSCPLCNQPLSIIYGYQPYSTESYFQVTKQSQPLPGYEHFGTITINAHISAGYQTYEDIDPIIGEPYSELNTEFYLPDNSEGEYITQMLQKAFNQRLLFRIGYNILTNRYDTIVPNGIELKTSKIQTPFNEGYPDPHYLTTLKSDLKSLNLG